MKHKLIYAGLLPLLTFSVLPAMAEDVDAVALNTPASGKIDATAISRPDTEAVPVAQGQESSDRLDVAKKPSWWRQIRATGSVQTEFLIPFEDAGIGLFLYYQY